MKENEKCELRKAINLIASANLSSKEWEDLFDTNDFEKAISIMTTAYSIVAANEEESLEKRAANILYKFGMPGHIRGYRYLIECMCLINEDKTYTHKIMERLYVDVAMRTNSEASRVERAIRHSIHVIFDREPQEDILQAVFGAIITPKKSYPTNKMFICRMAEIMGIL